MATYVVRHAKAGDREDWQGDDRLRPLTEAGHRQAQALPDRLRNQQIDSIFSSPYVRCVQTVEPLAEKLSLAIGPRRDLEEGSGGQSLIRIMQEFEGRHSVLCTHGDVVEELVELLIAQGLVSRAGARNEKAGTWLLDWQNGKIAHAKYLSAP